MVEAPNAATGNVYVMNLTSQDLNLSINGLGTSGGTIPGWGQPRQPISPGMQAVPRTLNASDGPGKFNNGNNSLALFWIDGLFFAAGPDRRQPDSAQPGPDPGGRALQVAARQSAYAVLVAKWRREPMSMLRDALDMTEPPGRLSRCTLASALGRSRPLRLWARGCPISKRSTVTLLDLAERSRARRSWPSGRGGISPRTTIWRWPPAILALATGGARAAIDRCGHSDRVGMIAAAARQSCSMKRWKRKPHGSSAPERALFLDRLCRQWRCSLVRRAAAAPIVHDALIHASAHEGMRLGRAEAREAARHRCSAFEHAIAAWRHRGRHWRIWIAVRSLYSMDGDQAPLAIRN